MTPSAWNTAFTWSTPHGLCVGVYLPSPDAFSLPIANLHRDDGLIAASMAPRRRPSWVGGRVALNLALSKLGAETPVSVSSTDRGAPVLPPGFVGSISHKDDIAVALVTPGTGFSLGVDLELWTPERPRIARHILTERERALVEQIDDPHEAWRHVIARFSIKECVFKALDPDLRRYIRFKEADVDWDGKAEAPSVHLALAPSAPHNYQVDATLRTWGEHLITSVRAVHLGPQQ